MSWRTADSMTGWFMDAASSASCFFFLYKKKPPTATAPAITMIRIMNSFLCFLNFSFMMSKTPLPNSPKYQLHGRRIRPPLEKQKALRR